MGQHLQLIMSSKLIFNRRVLGGAWAKKAGEIALSRDLLNRLGAVLVESVVQEAKRDLAIQGHKGTMEGDPVGLPTSKSFFESFSYRIIGGKTVEIISSWPWIRQVTEGRDPYPMTWLTRAKGVYYVPIVQRNGTVLVRTAPLTSSDAWIHPGFARHTFLERGIRKGKEKMAKIIAEEFKKNLSGAVIK